MCIVLFDRFTYLPKYVPTTISVLNDVIDLLSERLQA